MAKRDKDRKKSRSCPGCDRTHTCQVNETRSAPSGAVRRRLKCTYCGTRWTTKERLVKVDISPQAQWAAFDPGI